MPFFIFFQVLRFLSFRFPPAILFLWPHACWLFALRTQREAFQCCDHWNGPVHRVVFNPNPSKRNKPPNPKRNPSKRNEPCDPTDAPPVRGEVWEGKVCHIKDVLLVVRARVKRTPPVCVWTAILAYRGRSDGKICQRNNHLWWGDNFVNHLPRHESSAFMRSQPTKFMINYQISSVFIIRKYCPGCMWVWHPRRIPRMSCVYYYTYCQTGFFIRGSLHWTDCILYTPLFMNNFGSGCLFNLFEPPNRSQGKHQVLPRRKIAKSLDPFAWFSFPWTHFSSSGLEVSRAPCPWTCPSSSNSVRKSGVLVPIQGLNINVNYFLSDFSFQYL